jgi:hypothetical protein
MGIQHASRMLALRMNEALQCLGGSVGELPADRLDPMAEEGEPGYIPTVDIVRVARSNFEPTYLRAMAVRNGYRQFGEHVDVQFDNAVAVELTCRELLDAQRWLLERL